MQPGRKLVWAPMWLMGPNIWNKGFALKIFRHLIMTLIPRTMECSSGEFKAETEWSGNWALWDQDCAQSPSKRVTRICPWRQEGPDGPTRSTLVCMHAQRLHHIQLFATPWTVARQAPWSRRCFRQEYWSRLPFPPPGDLPDSGIKLIFPASPALAEGLCTTAPPGKPLSPSLPLEKQPPHQSY